MKKIVLLINLFIVTESGFSQILDSSFNITGYNTISLANFADYPKGIHQQASGKYIVTSVSGQGSQNYDYYAMRFNDNGSLDATFGTNGKTIVNFDTGYDELLRSVLQPDGKIVLVGGTKLGNAIGFGIVRLTVDGQFDTTFNNTGKLFLPINGNAYAYSVKIDSNNKIIVSGSSNNLGVIVKLNEDGSLDNSFDGDGILNVLNSGIFRDLIIDNQNNIVTVYSTPGNFQTITQTQGRAIVAKFTSSGAIDTTFGTNGILDLNLTASLFPSADGIRLLSNGDYLVNGSNSISNPYQSRQYLTRITSNGVVDTNYGTSGILYFPNIGGGIAYHNTSNDYVYMAVLKFNQFPTPNEKQLLKINANGTYDSSFGVNGVYTETTPNLDFGFAIGVDSQNRLIVSATFNYNTSGMARYSQSSLSNSNFDLSNNLNIFPNPTSGNFNIQIEENLINAKVSVYNMLGQNIKTFNLENSITNQILESGMYILEIEKESNKTIRKLIVN